MKNIEKYIIICLAMLLIVACQDDEYDAPDTVSDVTWYTSVPPGDEFLRATGGFISFLDASQGDISHEWTIEEGNHFLKTGFNDKDFLPDFIDSSKGLVTDDKAVHVLFMKEGKSTICLKNIFDEKVVYQTVDGPIEATQVGDKWVFEKCFEVEVIAEEIKPAFRILQDGIEILRVGEDDEIDIKDKDTWPTIDVEVNKTLTFIDLSKVGIPNARTWRINGGVPETSNDSIAEIAFLNFGTTVNLGRIESRRDEPLPTKTNWKYIPLNVSVVSSSEPFEVISEINEDETEKISFQVAGIIDPASLAGQNGNFTVNVNNTDAGFNQDIAVQAIEINSVDESILELTLADPIYNSDVVTISYSGGGIQSTDERPLEDFGPITVNMYTTNVLSKDIFGAEGVTGTRGGVQGFWAQHSEWFDTGGRSEEQAASGNASFKWSTPDWDTMSGGNHNFQGSGDGQFVADPGTYEMSLKVYLPSGSDMQAVRTVLQTPWTPVTWSFDGIAKDTWVTLTKTVNITTHTFMWLQMNRSDNPGISGAQTMYIDDIELAPIELRP
ncbi:SwmB domain-containing protein [Flavivirga algicola]|uniref:DUF5689 domain-containing protein n=1 Tax=Flavivirga algicola TaxID=2729136 RepID=A0ABX1RVY5_9FLAO|nr:SwmB domain-containing protein [Flavivirga algicola]NMH86838.1 hypothetical protein [Flavivirga algicola]